MTRFWKLFLAHFRLSKRAICEMSFDGREYHDWVDGDVFMPPTHFYTYHCVRCGKPFQI